MGQFRYANAPLVPQWYINIYSPTLSNSPTSPSGTKTAGRGVMFPDVMNQVNDNPMMVMMDSTFVQNEINALQQRKQMQKTLDFLTVFLKNVKK